MKTALRATWNFIKFSVRNRKRWCRNRIANGSPCITLPNPQFFAGTLAYMSQNVYIAFLWSGISATQSIFSPYISPPFRKIPWAAEISISTSSPPSIPRKPSLAFPSSHCNFFLPTHSFYALRGRSDLHLSIQNFVVRISSLETYAQCGYSTAYTLTSSRMVDSVF